MKTLKAAAAAAAMAALAFPAAAQDLAVKPLLDARLRYEHVEQDGLPLDAEALTLRARAGAGVSSGGITATVVGQANLAIVDDYNDGLHGPATRPVVADPESAALDLANIAYRTDGLTLTAGRQRITLDDERFVGNLGFRQNAQSFDAVRAEIVPLAGLKADVSYAWEVRTIWGIDGSGARPASIGGNNVFANLSWASTLGTLTGFAYFIEQDDPAAQAFRLSSQSYGGRLAGVRPLGQGVRLAYQLSHAVQSDWRRNPNDYRAEYWLADATLEFGAAKLIAGYEVLGADGGTALTSFQFPLGTNFKFQGWADKFLTTPPNGLRDRYAGVGYGWKGVGPLATLALQATYHRFDSDRLDLDYGEEIDLLASAAIGKVQLGLRYAHYEPEDFATDTDKLWLQLDWSL